MTEKCVKCVENKLKRHQKYYSKSSKYFQAGRRNRYQRKNRIRKRQSAGEMGGAGTALRSVMRAGQGKNQRRLVRNRQGRLVLQTNQPARRYVGANRKWKNRRRQPQHSQQPQPLDDLSSVQTDITVRTNRTIRTNRTNRTNRTYQPVRTNRTFGRRIKKPKQPVIKDKSKQPIIGGEQAKNDLNRLWRKMKKKSQKLKQELQHVMLCQSDFNNGTYFITEPGTYTLTQDIIFQVPQSEQNTLFQTAISIVASNVTIDLNGYTIAQAVEQGDRYPFYTNIEIGHPVYHEEGYLIPHSVKYCTIKNGQIGRSSYYGICGMDAEYLGLQNLVFHDYQVAAVALFRSSHVVFKDLLVNRNWVPPQLALSQKLLLEASIAPLAHGQEEHEEHKNSQAIDENEIQRRNAVGDGVASSADLSVEYQGIDWKKLAETIVKNLTPPEPTNDATKSNQTDQLLAFQLIRLAQLTQHPWPGAYGFIFNLGGKKVYLENCRVNQITHHLDLTKKEALRQQVLQAFIKEVQSPVTQIIQRFQARHPQLQLLNQTPPDQPLSPKEKADGTDGMNSNQSVRTQVVAYQFNGIEHLVIKNCQGYEITGHQADSGTEDKQNIRALGIHFNRCQQIYLNQVKLEEINNQSQPAIGVDLDQCQQVRIEKVNIDHLKANGPGSHAYGIFVNKNSQKIKIQAAEVGPDLSAQHQVIPMALTSQTRLN